MAILIAEWSPTVWMQQRPPIHSKDECWVRFLFEATGITPLTVHMAIGGQTGPFPLYVCLGMKQNHNVYESGLLQPDVISELERGGP